MKGGLVAGLLFPRRVLVLLVVPLVVGSLGAPATVLSAVPTTWQGWLALVAIKPIWQLVPVPGILLIFAGGMAYTGGLVFFAGRRRYSHFIWHLFVIAGTTFHFFAVLWYAAD